MPQKENFIQSLIHRVQTWVLPHLCCLCGEETETEQDLCGVCKTRLPWVEHRCYRCGLLMEDVRLINCQNCEEYPPAFDRLCTLFSYDPPVTKLITGLKFSKQLAYGRILGDLLAEAVLKEWYQNSTLPDAVIPMPLHPKRLKKRGYNQALELLWPILKRSNIQLLAQSVERKRITKPQSGLNREQRRHNMHRAFRLKNPLNVSHVAVIDDVVTTASTMNALCATLRDAGVQELDVWCICRA
jgi:ComF family protein